jgi:hypothetical protein
MVSWTTASGLTPMPKMKSPAAMPLMLPWLPGSSELPAPVETRTRSWPRKMMPVARIEARGVPILAVSRPPTSGVHVLLSLEKSTTRVSASSAWAKLTEDVRESRQEERELGVGRAHLALDPVLDRPEQVAAVMRADAEQASDEQRKGPLPALVPGWCERGEVGRLELGQLGQQRALVLVVVIVALGSSSTSCGVVGGSGGCRPVVLGVLIE